MLKLDNLIYPKFAEQIIMQACHEMRKRKFKRGEYMRILFHFHSLVCSSFRLTLR